MTSQDISLALAVERLGSGPPLVIMHGLLGSSRNWRAIGKELSATHSVRLVDLRNHGASPWSDRMDYEAMAADVLRLLEDEGLESASLIGHSMGGKVAMATALASPGCVTDLIVVDIAPVRYRSGLEVYVEAMRAVDLASMSRRSEVERALEGAVPEAAIRAFLAQNVDSSGGALRWKLNLEVILQQMGAISDWPPVLHDRTYSGRTLFLSGGKSDYVSPGHHHAMRRNFPDYAHEVIEGAGHWVHAEAPKATLDAIRTFLA